jgi:hypothetical protein
VLTVRSFVLAAASFALVSCAVQPPAGGPNLRLDLQVRNSGIRGGFVWLESPAEGRWHRLGQAEFLCLTCPVPIAENVLGYEIAVLDDSCVVVARHQVVGGELLLEIDPGPVVRLGPAPPLGDWLPGDSAPLDRASVPCPPP